jgi:hypothetical protein
MSSTTGSGHTRERGPPTFLEDLMNAAVDAYYTAWQKLAGDMSAVPLADDFTFHGPVASFTDAAGYRAMTAQAGAAVRQFPRPAPVRRG